MTYVSEYKTHFITRLSGGNPYFGCYSLAITIFSLGLAIENQPTLPELDNDQVKLLGAILFGSGMLFVTSSTYMLGITGTFLGDYFGILMNEKVTSFPFNILEHPMYYGSTMSFLGTALWYASPAGILLSTFAFIVYLVAIQYEGQVFPSKAIYINDLC
ncbi:9905_t:CDS:2 [Entrophospora sp. SA101]|nr:9905_t:CDS:2 [Entrophospora sp. SA101]